MNRLQQRLAHTEHAILPAGRICAVIDDGSEDVEARIARCRAQTGLSDRDLVVILKRFFPRAPGEAQEPPGRCGRWLASSMLSRIRDRLKALEAKIAPKGRAFVFLRVEGPDLPPYADQLAAFRAENGVGPNDTVHEVTVSFRGPTIT